jgi:hypothetical protein
MTCQCREGQANFSKSGIYFSLLQDEKRVVFTPATLCGISAQNARQAAHSPNSLVLVR